MRLRSRWIVPGVSSLTLGALPWLGLGSSSFAHPLTHELLPRLELLSEHRSATLRALYRAMELPPLALAELVPGTGSLVYFSGEGARTVRPVVVSHAWCFMGLACLVQALRRPCEG